MGVTQEQANGVTAAVWFVGLAALFATGFWWPGIMFVVGTSSVVQGLVRGRGWYAFQGALWTFGVGVWALLGYNIVVLFLLLALSALVGTFVRPPSGTAKPAVDTSLE